MFTYLDGEKWEKPAKTCLTGPRDDGCKAISTRPLPHHPSVSRVNAESQTSIHPWPYMLYTLAIYTHIHNPPPHSSLFSMVVEPAAAAVVVAVAVALAGTPPRLGSGPNSSSYRRQTSASLSIFLFCRTLHSCSRSRLSASIILPSVMPDICRKLVRVRREECTNTPRHMQAGKMIGT